MKLRIAHLRQLQSYIDSRNEDNCWYYGNKEQFEKRHAELLEWVQEMIDARD